MGTKAKFNLYDQHGFNQSKVLQSEKRSKQTKKLFRLLLVSIAGLLFFIGIVKLPSITSVFLKPFKNDQNNLTNYNKIDFIFRTNILLITSNREGLLEISLGSLDSTDKKVQILKFDSKQKLLGKEKDQTISEMFARKREDEKYLEKLTAKLIETLGLPIDGYIMIDQTGVWLWL